MEEDWGETGRLPTSSPRAARSCAGTARGDAYLILYQDPSHRSAAQQSILPEKALEGAGTTGGAWGACSSPGVSTVLKGNDGGPALIGSWEGTRFLAWW